MKAVDTKSAKLENQLTEYFHFAVILGVCLINIGISAVLRSSNIFFVSNPSPIGFSFGYYSSVAIIAAATWLLIKFGFFKKSPVYSIFILAGLYSNFVEKLIWNNVADYLTLGNLNLNLADIQIFLGIIMINVEVWARNRPVPETTNKKSKK